MTKQTGSLKGDHLAPITVNAGSEVEVPLPVEGSALGYAAVTGAARSDEDITVYLLQGKDDTLWLAGKTADDGVAVTGAALDTNNQGSGKVFAFGVGCAEAVLLLVNDGVANATVHLQVNMLGRI